MINLTIFAIATSTIPHTIAWNPAIGIVMVICNVGAIAFGKFVLPNPGVGTALPMPKMFGGMGWPALLATTSLGHMIGIGVILGLANSGLF